MKRGRERGFTLIEVVVVLAIIGIMLAFSIPALGRFYLEYRLNKVAREIRANIQLARLKAVTSNFDVVFTYNLGTSPTPDSYQISGTENTNGGSLQAWEDLNGNGVNDGLVDSDRNPANGLEQANLFAQDRQVENCNFGTNGLSSLPNGSTDFSPVSPIQFIFTSKGNVSSDYTGNCISLQNKIKMTQTVCIYPGGYTRLFKLQENRTWLEIF